MFNYVIKDGLIYIKEANNFDLAQTLDCGQAFRWSDNGSGIWSGIAFNRYIELYRDGNDIVIKGSDEEDFKSIWIPYFDFDRNYCEVINKVSVNETIKKAAEYGSGIRILRQEPWEALCSFIISQNNNIPRIKGIIERLCENFGDKCSEGFTFPEAAKLSVLTVEDLAPLRCGFRAKYIIDAAQKVASGEIDLEKLKTDDFEEARNTLMKIKGVGPKVADCTLLFGLGHIEAFPQDVWIKRAMLELFGGELPECALPYAGIVQQYIFYYAREGNLNS